MKYATTINEHDSVQFHRRLPRRCTDALDAEGVVHGKTWRDMRTGCWNGGKISPSLQAIAWFFHKRGLPCAAETRSAS